MGAHTRSARALCAYPSAQRVTIATGADKSVSHLQRCFCAVDKTFFIYAESITYKKNFAELCGTLH